MKKSFHFVIDNQIVVYDKIKGIFHTCQFREVLCTLISNYWFCPNLQSYERTPTTRSFYFL